ncbi:AAA family ATPase [Dolichospermum sp. ST_con]|nr:AAA family ATPase [Dolichospermum sp. ST_con]MDD1419755.1 AAA family ATPase [Dolichospermum sp. ST_sed1]MDD1423638.1 AAA family ATPase [Dolichospermum sp. ST_sed9]MDD1429578.1 AAA family ATPase [Dolichospermum sp. ST_sed6]MDD1436584.1 AAA family ATPase [Dolichospermum sp. ST_sed10]MDD1438852.1 AAA family ATPase [Dolichospermum sp. ST_sed3]MDD1447748.1 AAA family ATPase [Dolichospermum sp. ST_sed8]MDD1456111.1 AAA family ATPase [Dolichospermum sp. ST_sed7]MDD1458689.1 AAA family ATPase [D
MQIKQISVSGLFGIFDHVIPLNMDDRITVIHGPNGFGKTAMLTILDGLFNSRYSKLRTIPFSKFRVEFDDDSNIEIIKNVDNSEEIQNKIAFDFHQPSLDVVTFDPKIIPDIKGFPLHALEDFIPGLNRISDRKWLYTPTQENLSLEEVLERFGDLLPVKVKLEKEPEWLEKLKNNIHIRLIESQRLLNLVPNRRFKFDDRTPTIESTVSAYSNELAKLMQDKFKEYGTISQSLDRSFPMRVVKQQSSSDLTDEHLRNQLKELEETRSRLIEVGLLDQDEDSEFQIQPQDIDESTKNALSVYVEDVEKKLNVFNEIAIKINLLKRIINNKFSYKEINFSKEKGFIFTTLYDSSLSDSKILSPTDLSSGEQHELVLLYELLFKVKPNSLVLIDEPELSLHVGWQVEFLKDLQEITKLADVDILIATHSPDIIQDRWDLTVELKGSGK